MAYLILTLATWRISSLLVNEDGPWDMFTRLRVFAGVRYDGETFQQTASNVVAGAFMCIWCMSIWIGLILLIAWSLWPQPTLWIATLLALSAGAILIDKVTNAN